MSETLQIKSVFQRGRHPWNTVPDAPPQKSFVVTVNRLIRTKNQRLLHSVLTNYHHVENNLNGKTKT
ncbi:hypothetical protein VCHA57P526_50049 [Vibrio chagasii]|nr:hypothetical protein VCHA27O13_150095 [Vibrio chagasii]CAH6800458.1 hypothetical protein VCHA32P90_110127 [Vibrio chagasii]CAH6822530.1 hypothetical protein VCHA34O109_130153 [Vibrio chagasii]CAH6841120.1 hypothetical protein VCHA28FP16_10165 [Vibrio chagasii]CAH6865868.1 hypothetical protein VCHA31O73_240049 [Vibrio chagasii]